LGDCRNCGRGRITASIALQTHSTWRERRKKSKKSTPSSTITQPVLKIHLNSSLPLEIPNFGSSSMPSLRHISCTNFPSPNRPRILATFPMLRPSGVEKVNILSSSPIRLIRSDPAVAPAQQATAQPINLIIQTTQRNRYRQLRHRKSHSSRTKRARISNEEEGRWVGVLISCGVG